MFRVFPSIAGADPAEPGGALHVPRRRQGLGRVDNPEHYAVLYLAESPTAAVAERLQMFRGKAIRPAHLRTTTLGGRGRLGLVRLTAPRVAECDLDDPRPLLERSLIPSDVATGDRAVTQAWALRIWQEGRWRGVRYWSALEAKWPVVARWAIDDLTVERVEPLTMIHPAVVEAAGFLSIDLAR